MSLYHVQFDRRDFWVEASHINKVHGLWVLAMQAEFGAGEDGYMGDEELDSVALVTIDAVIREAVR